MSARPQVLVLLGPPGVGKGTQGQQLSASLGIPKISTGDMLRTELAAGTALGETIRECMASGGLVRDELVNQLVESRLAQPDCRNGFMLDGFPRSVPQARFLSALLARLNFPQPTILHLDAPRKELIRRLSSRRYCPECQRTFAINAQGIPTHCEADGTELAYRPDDDPAVIGERLRAYDATTAPVVAYYKAFSYFRIDGSQSPALVAEELACILSHSPSVSAAV